MKTSKMLFKAVKYYYSNRFTPRGKVIQANKSWGGLIACLSSFTQFATHN